MVGGLDPLGANLSYVTSLLQFLNSGSRQLGFQVRQVLWHSNYNSKIS